MSVWMRHPDLPGQPINVAESAVPQLRQSGWQTYSDSGEKDPEPDTVTGAGLTPEDLEFVPPEAIAPLQNDETIQDDSAPESLK